MARKHIAALKRFQSHLVIHGERDPAPGNSGGAGLSQLQDELLRAVTVVAEKTQAADRQSNAEAEQARPLLEQADRICGRWEALHPPTRGGGIRVKALGYYSLRRYVLSWLVQDGTTPSGTHRIPGRTEAFGRQAKDFDGSI